MIPMGQPILVGHHSEKRHRRDIGKMQSLATKGVFLSREADKLARRAAFAEKNTAVSSDDPEAVAKLRAKLASLEKGREQMRAADAAIRKGGDVVARLGALGFNEARAKSLLEKDPMGRIGFPAYALRNTSSEERRVKERIRQLEARASSPLRAPESIGDCTIAEAENRVRITFPAKPPEDMRRALKGAGFKFGRPPGRLAALRERAARGMTRNASSRSTVDRRRRAPRKRSPRHRRPRRAEPHALPPQPPSPSLRLPSAPDGRAYAIPRGATAPQTNPTPMLTRKEAAKQRQALNRDIAQTIARRRRRVSGACASSSTRRGRSGTKRSRRRGGIAAPSG